MKVSSIWRIDFIDTSFPLLQGILLSGNLAPDIAGFFTPVAGVADTYERGASSFAFDSGKWNLYTTSEAGFSVWQSEDTDLLTAPTPADAGGWVPFLNAAGTPVPTASEGRGLRAETRMLDYADLMENEFSIPAEQQASSYAAISAIWGTNQGTGGGQRNLTWSSQAIHASPAAARAYCLSHPARLPFLKNGLLRIAIQDGETWELESAVVLSGDTKPERGIPHATVTGYSARAGRTRPFSIIENFAGITPAWMNAAPSGIDDIPSSL